jgi:CO/xanthine dehydrogenase Mo-binding subunit
MATQTPHDHQALLAEVLGLPESEVRVIKPEVGGGFGSKSKFYPSELLAAWASVKLERPV